MGKYIVLIIGIGMLIGFFIYKVIKLSKYRLKIDAEVVRNIQTIDPNTNFYTIDDDHTYYFHYQSVYEYHYKGMIYHCRNGWDNKVGTIRKIRINPSAPNKAYIPQLRVAIGYLFLTFIFILVGTIILVGELYLK